ncbi:hypothetical protein GGI07_000453 [Coemansia sp. Benny D115]|nr:hypothetical protein GGI07_000453 [Coemansia sp. Benny D115]
MNTLHGIGLSQLASKDPAASNPTANAEQNAQLQHQQGEGEDKGDGSLLAPLPQHSQSTTPYTLTAASSVSPVAGTGNISNFAYTPRPALMSDAAAASIGSYASAYTLSSSTTPMAAPLHQQPPRQFPAQQLRLNGVPLYQPHSYQPQTTPSFNQGYQQYAQQPSQMAAPPSMLLNKNPITPVTSHQQNMLQADENPLPKPAHPKPRAPRNKSKFKRFRNAFIYFVNDQRNKVDDETKKLKNREFLQLMSARWKEMSEQERKPFVTLAEDDKKRFEQDVKKFGKYESRQRRFTKSRSHTKHPETHGTAPYTIPGSSATGDYTGGFAYTVNGNAIQQDTAYGNVGHSQQNINAPQSPFYSGLQPIPSPAALSAAALAAAEWSNNPNYGMFMGDPNITPNNPQRPQQQQSSLLSPSGGTFLQRNSNSSNESTSNIGDIQAALSPAAAGGGYQWTQRAGNVQRYPGALPNAAISDLTSVSMAQGSGVGGSGYFSNYQLTQPTSPGDLMQIPTGAPISHSLTEPMAFYGGNDNRNPYLSPSGNNGQDVSHM